MNDPSTLARPSTVARARGAVLRNVTSNWAALVVNTALSFVIAPIVVNSLGSVYYGLWTLLMQFTGYLWLLDFGVRESVIKYVAQYHAAGDERELEATVRTAVSLYAAVAALGLLASLGLAAALPYVFNIPGEAVNAARVTAFLTGATVAYSFLANVFVGVLMGLQRFYLVSRVGILFSIARAVAIYALLSSGFGIVSLAMVQLVLSVVSGFLVYVLCRRDLAHVSFSPIRPERAHVAKLLHFGKWVLVSNLGDKIIFSTDAIVIGLFLPIATLAYYAIAGTLIVHLRSFIQAMAAVFNPLSSSLQATNDGVQLARVVQSGAKFAVLVGLAPCIGFMLLGERFITLWMGGDYGPTAGMVLAVLAAGHAVGLPYATISGVLYGLGRHRTVAISRVVEGGANLMLSIVLVKAYGWVGAAIGTAIPHAIMVGAILPRLLPTIGPISLSDYYQWTYLRPALAAVPFALTCWALEHLLAPRDLVTFMVAGAFSLVSYVVPVAMLALTSEERAFAARTLRLRMRRQEPAVSPTS
jgi:O-antigen/teichoic acid export membrane protein